MILLRIGLAAAALLLTATAEPVPQDAPVARPTGKTVPANLLRLSIAFARPPEGAILPRLALVGEDGSRIEAPFLDQELWSPDGRTLTVLLHPGRVKTGLTANESLGRALIPGHAATLTLDGRGIGRWDITAPDLQAPDPRAWRADAPPAGSRAAVLVRLDAPVDAMAADLIAVRDASGARVAGTAQLGAGETVWRFTPRSVWRAERYTVLAAPDLEDPSGNRPGQDFEHAPGEAPVVADGPSFEPSSRRVRP